MEKGKVKSVRVSGWLLKWWEKSPNASHYVRKALKEYLTKKGRG